MSVSAWLMQLRDRIRIATPVMLRPLLVVAIVLSGMFLAQAAAVTIYRLGGETRTIQFRFLGYLGACMAAAALMYGYLRSLISQTSRLRPWILGMATSAIFWLAAAILSPTAIQSSGDAAALVLAILGFGAFVGFLLWRHQRSLLDA
jgi:hypothetical protein